MKSIVETQRLILRELVLADAPFIIELLNSAGWMQFIGDKGVRTMEQAENYLINGPMKSYVENGFGLCAVVNKENSAVLGICGLLKRDYLDNPDIGFAFLPDYNGLGYAYEIASATLLHAKEHLNILTVYAITLATNERSIKLLEKLSLTYNRKILIEASSEDLLLYSN